MNSQRVGATVSAIALPRPWFVINVLQVVHTLDPVQCGASAEEGFNQCLVDVELDSATKAVVEKPPA